MDNSFSTATLKARMNSDNYQSLLSMKTNYGGNFLTGLPTQIVASANNIVQGAITSVNGKINTAAASVTTRITSTTKNISNTASTLTDAPNALLEFTTVAIQDTTEKVQTQAANALKDIMRLPSLGDISAKSQEYLQYYLLKPENITIKLLSPQEILNEAKDKLMQNSVFSKFIEWISNKIGIIKEFINKYIKQFNDFIGLLRESATKGVDFLCSQVALMQQNIICSIDDLLYGGNSRVRMQIGDKQKQIDEYKTKIQSILRRLNTKITDQEIANLQMKKVRYEQKIQQIQQKIEKMSLKLSEREDSKKLQDQISTIRQQLQNATTIEEKDKLVHELINAESKLTARKGYVGFINSKKEIIVNNMAATAAKTTATPINTAMETALKMQFDKIEEVKEKAKVKVKSAIIKALLKLKLISES